MCERVCVCTYETEYYDYESWAGKVAEKKVFIFIFVNFRAKKEEATAAVVTNKATFAHPAWNHSLPEKVN